MEPLCYHYNADLGVSHKNRVFWGKLELTNSEIDRVKLTLFALAGNQTPTGAAWESKRQVARMNQILDFLRKNRMPPVRKKLADELGISSVWSSRSMLLRLGFRFLCLSPCFWLRMREAPNMARLRTSGSQSVKFVFISLCDIIVFGG